MKRHEIITSLLIPIVEMSGIIGIFFIAYNLRQITDGIPFIQLPIPYISPEQFLPFILSGTILWGVLFMYRGLYRYSYTLPLWETIRMVVLQSLLWFLFYIAFVYLTTGFIFSKDIPRLIIIYTYILSTLYAIGLRTIIYTTMGILYKKKYIEKNHILIIDENHSGSKRPDINSAVLYTYKHKSDIQSITHLIRNRSIDSILLLVHIDDIERFRILSLCSTYGVSFCYPSTPTDLHNISREAGFIGGIPIIQASALNIGVWDRIFKRIYDIIFAGLALIMLAPVFLIIMIAVKLEDPSGPVIYKNRRVGMRGREFFLYKFRYMYWRDSVKDAYGISENDDTALAYEESLKSTSDSRKGPLYKIQNDPRKTRVGTFLEKLSLDELPQLWNVLIGDMSLIGPRPHQPREVALYREDQRQVLTMKPGITGMGQVSGREKNTFDEEVAYDVYYIEHYSIVLDMIILIKTIGVVVLRAFR